MSSPGINFAKGAVAVGAIAFSYLGFKDYWGSVSAKREIKNDAFVRSSDYHFTRGISGAYSGNGKGMDEMATGWKRFWMYGPFDIKLKLHRLQAVVGDFVGDINNWVFTGLGVGGLYTLCHTLGTRTMPHHWVKGAAKFVWDTNILQTLGNGIRSLVARTNISGAALWTAQQLPKLGWPGVVAAGILGFMGMRFFDTVSGEAQREHFRGTVWTDTNYWPGKGAH